jgi:CheY-like chemotaxis protein
MENKKKILLVDDEPNFVELIRHRLQVNGYEVVAAADGKEALDILKEEKFDAVLLDILMPQMDGLTTLKLLRKHDKHLPVFMLTAHSDREQFRQANQLGASGFIMKTSDLQKEIANISSFLRISDKYKPQK